MRKLLKNKIALVLALILCVTVLGSCGDRKVPEKGSQREKNTVTVTATPTVTETPTATVTPTPQITTAPNPDEKPWSTPNFGKVTYNEEQKRFDDFMYEIAAMVSDGSGISLHFYFENPEQYGMKKQLDFGSAEDAEAQTQEYGEKCRTFLARLKEFKYEELTAAQKVNYDRLEHEINAALRAENLNPSTYCGLFCVNGDIVDDLSTIISEYAFYNEQDIQDFFTALDTFPAYLDQVGEAAKKAYLSDGCLLTKKMIDTLSENVDGLTAKEHNPLVEAFAENIKQTGVSDSAQQAYIAQYQEKLNSVVFPALNNLKAVAEGMRGNVSKELFGMCALDGGKEYFEYLVQETVGTSMNGYEQLQYMQKKFEQDYNEMVEVVSKDISIIYKYPYQGYTVTDPRQMLDSLKEYIKTNYPAIPDTDYIVSALPEALQIPGVLAYFLTPQFDNQARKVIRYNPSSVDSNDLPSFFSTLAHEGYPGHLYQNEFFANCEGWHPLNMLFSYTGYMEGWAVVAGQEAYKYIIPDPDIAYISAVDYNISMDLVSVTTLGVHYAGWTVDDVKAFMRPYGYEMYAEDFYEEILADPVVYLPYTMGRHLMLDTMDKLKAKGYTDMEAKTAILNIGPCTFDVMWKELGIQ